MNNYSYRRNNNNNYEMKSYKSFRRRLSGSFMCMVMGGILFFCAPALLFWNEGRAVYQAKTLKEARSKAVTVPTFASWNNGKLIHVTGFAKPAKGTSVLLESDLPTSVSNLINTELNKVQNVVDNDPAASAPDASNSKPAIVLKREVEYYEWKESKKETSRKTAGGGEETTTTYSYSKGWTSSHIDSSRFHETRHSNFQPKYNDKMKWTSGTVELYDQYDNDKSLGFKLDKFLLETAGNGNMKPVDMNPITWRPGQDDLITSSSGYNEIGDHRFTWEITKPHVVSLIGEQQGDGTIRAWRSNYGVEFHKLVSGTKTYDEIISIAEGENTMMTWLIRAGGIFLWYVSFTSMAQPLGVIADLGTIPCIGLEPGTILNYITGIAAFLLALLLSLIVIAFAWFWYRPLYSCALIVGALVTTYFLNQNVNKKKKRNN